MPKLTMNESIALFDVRPKSRSARSGKTARSRPTSPPTKALTTTSSANCRQFRRRPSVRSASGREIDGADFGSMRRRRGNVAQHGGDEFGAIVEAERSVETALETNRRRGFAAQPATADRAGECTGPDLDVIRKLAQARCAIEEHVRALIRSARQLGTSHVTDHQRVTGERHPRFGAAGAIRHEQRRSEEHTSELQSHSDLVCRLLLEKKNHLP